MRCLPFLLVLAMMPAAAVAKPAPSAADAQQNKLWVQTGESILLKKAGIAFPSKLGDLSISGTKEFSHAGEGLDAAVQYSSPDEQVYATAYLFFPGLAHPGLAAWATDNAIRTGSPSLVGGGEMRIANAAGVSEGAIQADYSNYRNGQASSAAFIKAGRWLVKLRVSGPEARKQEVESAMAALLAGIRVPKGTTVYPARPLSITPCPKGEGSSGARMLADPATGEKLAQAFLGTFDGAGIEAKVAGTQKTTVLPSRVPTAFCRSNEVVVGDAHIPVLRSADAAPEAVDGRTRLIVILSDSGSMLELVYLTNFKRYLLLHHDIGGTALLSGWDGVPSDAQIANWLSGADNEATRTRAIVRHSPGKADSIDIADTPAAKAAPVS